MHDAVDATTGTAATETAAAGTADPATADLAERRASDPLPGMVDLDALQAELDDVDRVLADLDDERPDRRLDEVSATTRADPRS